MLDYTQHLFIEDQKRSVERLKLRLADPSVTDVKAKRYLRRQIKKTEAYLAKMDAWMFPEDIPAELKELEE